MEFDGHATQPVTLPLNVTACSNKEPQYRIAQTYGANQAAVAALRAILPKALVHTVEVVALITHAMQRGAPTPHQNYLGLHRKLQCSSRHSTRRLAS